MHVIPCTCLGNECSYLVVIPHCGTGCNRYSRQPRKLYRKIHPPSVRSRLCFHLGACKPAAASKGLLQGADGRNSGKGPLPGLLPDCRNHMLKLACVNASQRHIQHYCSSCWRSWRSNSPNNMHCPAKHHVCRYLRPVAIECSESTTDP